MGRNATILLAALFIMAGMLGGGYFVYRSNTHIPPTASISESFDFGALGFTAYVPTDRSEINAGSITYSVDVLTYTLHVQDIPEDIVVTQQAKPTDYDYSKIKSKQEFKTKFGDAYVVDFDDRSTGSLVTDKTWVILNTPTSIGLDAMERVVRNLVPAN